MKNTVPTNDFCVEALIRQVRERYGKSLSSNDSYELLSDDIQATTGEHINPDTLRRLTGSRKDGYANCRRSTLDILARYAGQADWETYSTGYLSSQGIESDVRHRGRVVRAADCVAGQRVTLKWLPDRRCVLEYIGDMRWEVVEVANSHALQAGDTFACGMICEDETLLGDDLKRDGVSLGALRLGLDNGVKIVDGICLESEI